jgi:soluble lytic murein transglycosylase-like protein
LVADFRVRPQLAQRIVTAVYRETQARGLSPALVLAVIAAESSFDPAATSAAGARGLMQVLPRSHRALLGRLAPGTDLALPENNIRIGTTILLQYLARSTGDLDAALNAYSGGSLGYAQRIYTHLREFNAYAPGQASAGEPALAPLTVPSAYPDCRAPAQSAGRVAGQVARPVRDGAQPV